VIRVSNEPAKAQNRRPENPESSIQHQESRIANGPGGRGREAELRPPCAPPFPNNPAIHQSLNPSGSSTFNSFNPINSVNASLATYSTWCPKFIAAIGHLPETLADRCIVIRMQRKREGEECARMRDLVGDDVREQCARLAEEHREVIARAKPEIPKTLNDRAADIWEPLFVIADLARGEWPEKARAAALALTAGAQQSSPAGSLLFDLAYLFEFVFRKERAFSQDIVKSLNCDYFATRPWREARNGKPITEIWLSQQLRPYGARPKNMRAGARIVKGYHLADLKPAFRYIPPAEFENLKAEVVADNAANRPTEPEKSPLPS
jgi:hypothetical protein